MNTTKKGFAAMTIERVREIAQMGGRTAHATGKGHKWTPEQARLAGKKGGATIGQRKEHMREIGRAGGRA